MQFGETKCVHARNGYKSILFTHDFMAESNAMKQVVDAVLPAAYQANNLHSEELPRVFLLLRKINYLKVVRLRSVTLYCTPASIAVAFCTAALSMPAPCLLALSALFALFFFNRLHLYLSSLWNPDC